MYSFLGQYAPLLLCFINAYLLLFHKTQHYLFYFLLFLLLSLLFNYGIKPVFGEPRPFLSKEKFHALVRQGIRFHNGIDIYGMPSRHAQVAIFNTVFNGLVFQNPHWGVVFIILSLITMWERVADEYHTLFQVVVGGGFGLGFAFMAYYFSRKKLQGGIQEKPDDRYFG